MEQKPAYRTGDGQKKNKPLWVHPSTHAQIKTQAARLGMSIKAYIAMLADIDAKCHERDGTANRRQGEMK